MDPVSLELTNAEALVLFAWMTRNDEAELLQIEDHAEQRVLWTLEGQLEKTLVETLAPNYANLLEAARAEVREQS